MHVVRLLVLSIARRRITGRIAGVFEGGLADRMVRRSRITELERAAHELRRGRERAGVDKRLEMLLVDVPVADVEHDRAEREQHGKEQREENDDLTALVVRAAAATPCAPFPLHSSSPEDVGSHCAPLPARM